MFSRRHVIAGAGAALLGGSLPARAQTGTFEKAMADIERQAGGRLGVAMLDLASEQTDFHRADERFPMCSTFKFLAAAALLRRADEREEHLGRRVRYEKSDIVPYSPVTEKRAGDPAGITLGQLCEAAMILSDNTAGNLILDALGGPEGLTAFARSIGDTVTRLDRTEPSLNEALPDDPRDTTSPRAMAENMRKLVLGDVLKPASREQLTAWLRDNRTGDTRIRSVRQPGWVVGDKTGTGERGTSNDIAVLWPPGRPPIVLAVYLTGAAVDRDKQNAAIAAVAGAAVTALKLS